MTTSTPLNKASIQLEPSLTLPLVLVFAAVPMVLLAAWVGALWFGLFVMFQALFGMFLLIQAITLRLEFTETAPILFDPKMLHTCLEQRCPRREQGQQGE